MPHRIAYAARKLAVRNITRASELLWARLVLQAWRQEAASLASRRHEAMVGRLLQRQTQQRRQRGSLQRWASNARAARTEAATRLIEQRCQAALTSALLGGSFPAGAPAGAPPAVGDDGGYEPLLLERRASLSGLLAPAAACLDEDYTPFYESWSSPKHLEASTGPQPPHRTALRGTPARPPSSATRTLADAPVHVEKVAQGVAAAVVRLVKELRGVDASVDEWVRAEVMAAVEAVPRAAAEGCHGGSLSAPATPPSGWHTVVRARPRDERLVCASAAVAARAAARGMLAAALDGAARDDYV